MGQHSPTFHIEGFNMSDQLTGVPETPNVPDIADLPANNPESAPSATHSFEQSDALPSGLAAAPETTTQPADPSTDASNDQASLPTADPGPDLDARTRANRQNAQVSTGAKTPAGKAVSSKNAAKHCLFAGDITEYFHSSEEHDRYNRFMQGIMKDLRPVGDLETTLARRAADIQFRLDLLRHAEFMQYSEGGLVSGTMPGILFASKNPMGLASLYDSRFQRAFKVTMDELRKAQQARRDEEKRAIDELKSIALAHLQQNAPFDPRDFGFDISNQLLTAKAVLMETKKLASHCMGDGVVEKKVVAAIAKVPKKAA
jgi:hypothetical protein